MKSGQIGIPCPSTQIRQLTLTQPERKAMPRPDGTQYESEKFAEIVASQLRSMMPVKIGGTHVDDERVSGPPSRMLPALRDLATGMINLNEKVGGPVRPVVTIEIDTQHSGRKTGVINSLSKQGDETLYIRELAIWPVTSRRARVVKEEATVIKSQPTAIKLTNIIAFRVLKVEVDLEEVPS